jgi:hypothetical protein
LFKGHNFAWFQYLYRSVFGYHKPFQINLDLTVYVSAIKTEYDKDIKVHNSERRD